jgi:hypothetical protein
MDIEDQGQGPFEQVLDVLILAAIERAERHGGDREIWEVEVAEHLEA